MYIAIIFSSHFLHALPLFIWIGLQSHNQLMIFNICLPGAILGVVLYFSILLC